MTAPVTVTQAARIAAANHALDNSLIYSREYTAILAGGSWDQWPLVQAFARFEAETRQQAEAASKAREDALVEALEAIQKTMDGYRSQMKFCDIEALGYFREFDRRIEGSGFRQALARAKATEQGEG